MFPRIDLGTVTLPWAGEVHLHLPTYGLFFASGVLLAWWWFARRGRRLGVPDEQLFNLTFYTLLAGILGAKLALVLVDWRAYLSRPLELLYTVRAAGVLIGGVIAGGLVFAAYARRHGLPGWKLADALAAPLAMAQAVGRLGCFSAGCCWGTRVPDGPLAVTFTDPVAAEQTGVPLGVPLLPVQLIQMAHDLALSLLLTWLWRRRPAPDGTVAWCYVLLYSLGRGTIEFWRGDSSRGLYLRGWLGGEGLSTSQLLAAGGAAVAAWMLVRGRLRPTRPAR